METRKMSGTAPSSGCEHTKYTAKDDPNLDRQSLVTGEPDGTSFELSTSCEENHSKIFVEHFSNDDLDSKVNDGTSLGCSAMTQTDERILGMVHSYFDAQLLELSTNQRHAHDLQMQEHPKSHLFWTKAAQAFNSFRVLEQCEGNTDLDPMNDLAGCSEFAEYAIVSEHISFLPRLFTILSHQNAVVRPILRLSLIWFLANAASKLGRTEHPLFKICSLLDKDDSCTGISTYSLLIMHQLSKQRLGRDSVISGQLSKSIELLDQKIVAVPAPDPM